MDLTLKRISYTEEGTFGVLLTEYNKPFAVTLERPWLDNRRMVSCIPTNEYICRRVNSPKFGNTFEVIDVPNRSHILFHKGNIDDDSHGCILVGEQFGTLNDNTAILASKQGFAEFLNITSNIDEFTLYIEDC